MGKAQVIETVERDGVKVEVYDNGMERNAVTKRMLRGPTAGLITAENATLFHRRRQEKTASLLRQRIRQQHSAGGMTPVRSSAEAFAESGALLYEEVVLNAEAYPRDRLEAWQMLGRYAQVLPAAGGQPAEPAQSTPAEIVTAVAGLVRELAAAIQPARADVVDATAQADAG